MGVPGFYKWIVQRYPLVRRRLSDVSRPKIDYFYIDFNCIVYNALRLTSSDYPFTSLFQEISRSLDLLVQMVRPQIVLFIAVDGPAPLAKCAQQRSRRFVAARDSVAGNFDTTMISVGTEFMELLNVFLKDFIEDRTKTDVTWQKPAQVIYSSHRSPGEGEHKFFNYVRTQITNGRLSPNATHCVYSPDADLIFLGMQTRQPYFYILREWNSWIGPFENVGNGKLDKLRASENDFEYIHLSLVREYMKLDYPQISDVNRIIDDFASFSFLIGNDFVPHFPDISIQFGQFDTIINTYQSTLMDKHIFLIENGAINKKALQILLIATQNAFSRMSTCNNLNDDPEVAADLYLKQKYPHEYNGKPEDKEKFAKKLAFAVLDSFDWVLSYYTKGCQSWTWCFPYFYAPPISVIAKYCTEHISNFELDRPPMPFEQLLCIMPPKSACLLPKECQNLMTNKTSPLKKYYPDTFSVDLNGRKFEHEGVVLIPLVDVKEIREEFAKVLPQISEEDKIRNTFMCDLLISNGKSRNFDINNDIIPPSGIISLAQPIGIPSFGDAPIQFSCSKEKLKVDMFSRESFNPSLCLHFCPKGYKSNLPMKANDVSSLLNASILIDWPHLRPALVSRIIDRTGCTIPVPENQKTIPKNLIEQEFENIITKYRKKYGIDINDSTNIILEVNPMISTSTEYNRFRFSESAIFVPYQLTVSVHNALGFIKKFRNTTIPKPELNSPVVITNVDNNGMTGQILEVDGESVKIRLHSHCSKIFSNHKNPVKDIIDEFEHEEWRPLDYVIEKYRINYQNLLNILSSIETCNERDINFAFTAFCNKCVLDGCCRKVKNQKGRYDLTNDFIIELGEFLNCEQSGSLFSIAKNANSKMSKIEMEKIFGIKGKGAQKVKAGEFGVYLKKTSCKKFFLIDEDVDFLSQSTLKRIESLLVKNSIENSENNDDDDDDEVVVTVLMEDLIWPGKPNKIFNGGNNNDGKSDMMKIEIGSRVINVSRCGPIPFAAEGCIVAVDRKNLLIDVVLDNEYQFGTNLRKRLETKRGYTAKLDDLYIL